MNSTQSLNVPRISLKKANEKFKNPHKTAFDEISEKSSESSLLTDDLLNSSFDQTPKKEEAQKSSVQIFENPYKQVDETSMLVSQRTDESDLQSQKKMNLIRLN